MTDDVATAPTEPPVRRSTSAEEDIEALIDTATHAVVVAQRLAASNLDLRTQLDHARDALSAATALCVALDQIPLSMNPGPRAAVVDCVAARIVLVEKLARLSR